MEEKEIVECKCGADSRWIISNDWICCNKCGQEYQIKVRFETYNGDKLLVKRGGKMKAYNFRFQETGVPEIDKILSAVAYAARLYHNSTDWVTTDEVDGQTGNSPVERIQNAAFDAAKVFKNEGQ
jgi:hypothetical protein